MINLDGMSDEEVLAYAQKQMPRYRQVLSRMRSFVMGLFGRNSATAASGSYEKIDINALGDGVKSAGKISLTNFKAPSFTKMKSHVAALQESDTIDELEAIIDRLTASPSATIKQSAKSMIGLLAQMQNAFNTAQEALEDMADKHIPKEVAEIFEDAQKTASSIITSYADAKKAVVLPAILQIGSEDDRIDFCYYMEASEFVERKMWIIVTCALSKVGEEYLMSRHVTVQDRFQAPMMYDFGVATTDIQKSLLHALAEEGVLAAMSTVKLNLDETRITAQLKRLSFFKSVSFDDRTVNVFVKNNKQVFEQQKEIFAVLSTDTDIRRLLGRTKRLHASWENDHWEFVVSARS